MKRLLLAGVSLTVTACSAPSAGPPSTASLATARSQPSQYLLSLAATPDCTIWRDAGGTRVCLDGAAAAEPGSAQAQPQAAAEKSRTSRVARETGQDYKDGPAFNRAASAPAAPQMAAGTAPVQAPVVAPGTAGKTTEKTAPGMARGTVEPRMPQIADASKREATLFDEMQKIGMLDSSLRVIGAPPRMVLAQAPQAQAENRGLPKLPVAGLSTPPVLAPSDLPQLPKAAQGVIAQAPERPVAMIQAFAQDPTVSAVRPAAEFADAPAPAGSMSAWKPVDAGQRTQLAQSQTMGRAPVAPVERTELPQVRDDAVVPLKIQEKATDQRPAVVVPAGQSAPRTVAANPGAAPELPALPSLPGAAAPAPQPIAPAAQFVPPPPSMPAKAAAAQPAVQSAPAAIAPKAAESKPVAAKPAQANPAAKAQSGKLPQVAPGAGPASGGARYLVIHSFTDQQKAQQLAQKYGHLGATVATAQVRGQTWHRVVVRDGAAQRDRLTADGVRGYWPVLL